MTLSVLTCVLGEPESLALTFESLKPWLGPAFTWTLKFSETAGDAFVRRFEAPHVRILKSRDRSLYEALNQGLRALETTHYLVIGAGDTLLAPGVQALQALPPPGPDGPSARFAPVFITSTNTVMAPDPSALAQRMSCPHPGAILQTARSRALGGFDTRYEIASDYDHLSRYVRAFGPGEALRIPPLVRFAAGGMSERRSLEGYLEEELIRTRIWHSPGTAVLDRMQERASRTRHVRSAMRRMLERQNLAVSPLADPAQLAALMRDARPWKAGPALIRLGAPGDGGYLVPDDLDGIVACFSPGVSTVADFEADLAARGIDCHLADGSVDGPPFDHPRFRFEKTFLGSEDDTTRMRLASWVRRNAPPQGDLLLQMDIEGAEYDVLLDTPSEILRRFRIIVIEFHDLEMLFTRPGFALVRLCLQRLLRDFVVVHLHPNNCAGVARKAPFTVPSVMEFTFLRRDRAATLSPALDFPHPLDRANTTEREDPPLPPCWYRPLAV